MNAQLPIASAPKGKQARMRRHWMSFAGLFRLLYSCVYSCWRKGYFVLHVPQKMTNEAKRTGRQKPWPIVESRRWLGVRGPHAKSLSSSSVGTLTHTGHRRDAAKTSQLGRWARVKRPDSSHLGEGTGAESLSDAKLGVPPRRDCRRLRTLETSGWSLQPQPSWTPPPG